MPSVHAELFLVDPVGDVYLQLVPSQLGEHNHTSKPIIVIYYSNQCIKTLICGSL